MTKWLGVALVSALGACSASVGPGERSRFYGNMPLVVDTRASLATGEVPFHFAPHHIANDDNLLALHMDWFPVPWAEFAAGTAPPPAWEREMDRIAALQQVLGLPVYLALTPIGGNRDRLAPQATGTSALGQAAPAERCAPLASQPDAESIRRGYRAYVDYMVARFRPRFLALSIEVNVYAVNCPAAWDDMKAFLNETYAAVKSTRPDLTVFHTFQIEWLWQANQQGDPCFGFKRECLGANWAPLRDLRTDLFAISTYPIATYVNAGRRLPDDYLTVFSTFTPAPLAVAETGWQAVTFSGEVDGRCIPGLPSSEADQRWWMRRLLGDAEHASMPFVVWWANEDLMPAAVLAPCECQDASEWCSFLRALDRDGRNGIRFFGTMGLRDFDGTPRPALADWKAAPGR